MEATYQAYGFGFGGLGATKKKATAPKATAAKAKPAAPKKTTAAPKTTLAKVAAKTTAKAPVMISRPTMEAPPLPFVVPDFDVPPVMLSTPAGPIRTAPVTVQVTTSTPGQGKYSKTLDVISKGLDVYANRNSGGNQLVYDARDRTGYEDAGAVQGRADRDIGTDIGERVGRAGGGVLDTIKNIVRDYPLATLIAGGAVGLYFIQPKGGGFSRGR